MAVTMCIVYIWGCTIPLYFAAVNTQRTVAPQMSATWESVDNYIQARILVLASREHINIGEILVG